MILNQLFENTKPVTEAVEDRTSYQVAKALFDYGIKYDPARENELIKAIGMVLVKELNMSPKMARGVMNDEDFLGDTLGELRHMESGVAEGYRDRRDAYQRDYDSSVSGMGKRDSYAYSQDGGANDERHDLDPSEWYIVKDGKMYKVTVYPNQEQEARARGYSPSRDEAKAKAGQQGVAKGSLNEFAPGNDGGESGRWYTDSELADIIGDDWFEDFDVSNDGFNMDAHGEKAKKNLVGYANSWFDDKGYNVNVLGVENNEVDHDLQWYVVGSFYNPNFADKNIDEGSQRVDSLVTDALKIMRGGELADAVQALKTVLGDREFSSRRGHYNFYVRQLMDMYGQQGLAEGLGSKLAGLGLAGAMALGSAGANARVTPDGQGGYTGGLKPTATVTAPSDNKPAAEAPKGFSKEYLQKAADPNRTGRYMISVEKAQELLNNMQEGVNKSQVPTNTNLWKRATIVAEGKFKSTNEHSLLFASKWYQQHGGTWKKG